MSNSLMTGSVAHVLDAIGGTPIVKLQKMAEHVPADIYVKLEYMNPGGSVKDRIGINIIDRAEAEGLIQPGGTIVEATSGNTGMGLALVAAVRGYKCIFVMPDKISEEKVASLRAVGARGDHADQRRGGRSPLILLGQPPNRRRDPQRLLRQPVLQPSQPGVALPDHRPGAVGADGRRDRRLRLGPRDGRTISGTGSYLKERKPSVKCVGGDPIGSIYYDLKRTGKMTEAFTYKVEGVGEDILPGTIDLELVDEIFQVTDRESFHANREPGAP